MLPIPDHLQQPRPRQVADQRGASESGLVPKVPDQPPRVSVRPSAQAIRRGSMIAVAAVVLLLLLIAVIGSSAAPGLVGVAGIVVVLPAAVALVVVPRRLQAAILAEAVEGYTTLTGPTVIPTRGRLDAYWLKRRRRVEYHLDGLWRLDTDGTVLARPDRAWDPPGYYPSPHVEGRYQLWTGRLWTGHHVDPPG